MAFVVFQDSVTIVTIRDAEAKPNGSYQYRRRAIAFAQDEAEAAGQQWRRVADQMRPKVPNSPP